MIAKKCENRANSLDLCDILDTFRHLVNQGVRHESPRWREQDGYHL